MVDHAGNWQKALGNLLKRASDNNDLKTFQELSSDDKRVQFVWHNSFLESVPWLSVFFGNCRDKTLKSTEKTRKLRTDGNRLFQKKDYEKAIELYGQSILYAPLPSHEGEVGGGDDLALSFANRAATFCHLKKYKLCLLDVAYAIQYGYPANLMHKLHLRKGQCFVQLGRKEQAEQELKAALKGLEESSLEQDKKDIAMKEILDWQAKCSNVDTEPINCGEDFSAPSSVSPSLSYGINSAITQASSALRIMFSADKGRYIVTDHDLSEGDTLVVEQPYAGVLLPDHYHSHCFHCYVQLTSFLPCPSCIHARFCSITCQQKALASYHSIECPYLQLLHSVGIAHLGLRVVLLSGYRSLMDFKASVLDHTLHQQAESGFMGLDSDGCYRNSYLTVYHLLTQTENMNTEDLFQYALTAAVILKILEHSKFIQMKTIEELPLPEDLAFDDTPDVTAVSDELGKARLIGTTSHDCSSLEECSDTVSGSQKALVGAETHDQDMPIETSASTMTEKHAQIKGDSCLRDDEFFYIGGLLLRHIQQLVCNAHAITELQVTQTEQFEVVENKSQVRVATAIYPTASLMNHSCDPNIISSFSNDTLIVKATRSVKQGCEIFSCYGPHHRRMSYPERQETLKQQYFFTCVCESCATQGKTEVIFQAYRCPKCEGAMCPETVFCSEEDMTKPSPGHIICQSCDHMIETAPYRKACDLCEKQFQQALEMLEKKSVKLALEKLEECYARQNDILYKHHRQLAQTEDCLAKCFAILGDYPMAVEYLHKSIKTTEEIYGTRSVEIGNELYKLAELLVNTGQIQESLSTTRRALDIFQTQYGHNHQTVEELLALENALLPLINCEGFSSQ